MRRGTGRAEMAALAAALLAGCYTVRYERRSATPEPGTARERWHHGVLGGTVPASRPVKLPELCPDGVASVTNETTFPNFLGQLLTSFGALAVLNAPLWEPTTVSVVCARSSPRVAVRVVLLPLAALGGVPEDTARLLGEALAGELRRKAGVSVITPADVSALLGVERTRQVLGCTDAGCMAELGGALGADRVIQGSLGRVGDSVVLNLVALDPRKARAIASASERLRAGDDDALLDALPRVADRLLSGP